MPLSTRVRLIVLTVLSAVLNCGQAKSSLDDFLLRCSPINKLSTRIDTLVKFPISNEIFAFSGHRVSLITSIDKDGRPGVSKDYPREIFEVFPDLEPDLDAAFSLDSIVYFIKGDMVWRMSAEQHFDGPSPLVDVLPWLTEFEDISDVTTFKIGKQTRIIVYHHVDGHQLISVLDGRTKKVKSALKSNVEVAAIEVLEHLGGGKFDAIVVNGKTFGKAIISTNGVIYESCSMANELIVNCPQPICFEDFKIDAITELDDVVFVFSNSFVYRLDSSSKKLISVDEVGVSFKYISSMVNATFVVHDQMFVISGGEVLVYEIKNKRTKPNFYRKNSLEVEFEKCPKEIEAAMYNDLENAIYLFANSIYWKYKYDGHSMEFEGVGAIHEFGEDIPKNIDGALFDAKQNAFYFFASSFVHKIYESFFGVRLSEWSATSSTFFGCSNSTEPTCAHGDDHRTRREEVFAAGSRRKSKVPNVRTNSRSSKSPRTVQRPVKEQVSEFDPEPIEERAVVRNRITKSSYDRKLEEVMRKIREKKKSSPKPQSFPDSRESSQKPQSSRENFKDSHSTDVLDYNPFSDDNAELYNDEPIPSPPYRSSSNYGGRNGNYRNNNYRESNYHSEEVSEDKDDNLKRRNVSDFDKGSEESETKALQRMVKDLIAIQNATIAKSSSMMAKSGLDLIDKKAVEEGAKHFEEDLNQLSSLFADASKNVDMSFDSSFSTKSSKGSSSKGSKNSPKSTLDSVGPLDSIFDDISTTTMQPMSEHTKQLAEASSLDEFEKIPFYGGSKKKSGSGNFLDAAIKNLFGGSSKSSETVTKSSQQDDEEDLASADGIFAFLGLAPQKTSKPPKPKTSTTPKSSSEASKIVHSEHQEHKSSKEEHSEHIEPKSNQTPKKIRTTVGPKVETTTMDIFKLFGFDSPDPKGSKSKGGKKYSDPWLAASDDELDFQDLLDLLDGKEPKPKIKGPKSSKSSRRPKNTSNSKGSSSSKQQHALSKTGLKRANSSKSSMSAEDVIMFKRTDDTFAYDCKYNWGWPLLAIIVISGVIFVYCFFSTRVLLKGQKIPRHQLNQNDTTLNKIINFRNNKSVELGE